MEVAVKKIFVINPGSTSTKIALFEGEKKVFQKNVDIDIEKLKECPMISDQLPFRMETIESAVLDAGLDMSGIDAFSTRSGALVGLEGGVYAINDKLYEHAKTGYTVRHPNMLGPQIARALAAKYGGECFTVNPPDVDELDVKERVCGFRELCRQSKGHPLNQKENCIRYAKSVGRRYEDMNLICCHLGGGVTVAAHRCGRMFCVNDTVNGDGPMTPTRAGWLPATDVVKLCFSGEYTEREMYDRITKTGGFSDHLGTADTRKIHEMIDAGDAYAKIIYDAFIYQVGKAAGGCAAALEGKVDAIILTGGISYDAYVCEGIEKYVGWIAPIVVQAGEFEMEGLAAGAIAAINGEAEIKQYTGIPVWQGWDDNMKGL
jgi:butyrate kinase